MFVVFIVFLVSVISYAYTQIMIVKTQLDAHRRVTPPRHTILVASIVSAFVVSCTQIIFDTYYKHNWERAGEPPLHGARCRWMAATGGGGGVRTSWGHSP